MANRIGIRLKETPNVATYWDAEAIDADLNSFRTKVAGRDGWTYTSEPIRWDSLECLVIDGNVFVAKAGGC